MRLDGDHLDVDEARRRGATDLQLRVVELWNDDTSWRAIAAALGISVRSARNAWGSVNLKLRGDELPDEDIRPEIFDATIGNEDLLRGIPVSGFGGAIRGTRPGDPSWRAVIDQANAQTYRDQQRRGR